MNLLFKLSYLNLNFALTLGYLNLALNNPALVVKELKKLYCDGVSSELLLFNRCNP